MQGNEVMECSFPLRAAREAMHSPFFRSLIVGFSSMPDVSFLYRIVCGAAQEELHTGSSKDLWI